MKTIALPLLLLSLSVGCLGTRSVAERTPGDDSGAPSSRETYAVSGDDPVIRLPGGETIGVDGVPAGETQSFEFITTTDERGRQNVSAERAE